MSETTNPPPCPSPAELRAFAVGDLRDDEIDRIASHVLRCGPCDRALWSLDGTWQQILARLRAGSDEAEGADWTVSADSTVVRAHQHAAGARHAPPAELVMGGAAE